MRKERTGFYDSTVHLTNAMTKNERFVDSIVRFYRSYTCKTVLHYLRKEQSTIEWHCYECKCAIDVDVKRFAQGKRFNPTELFCAEHKPTNYSILRTSMFIRYQDLFFKFLTNTILTTSLKQIDKHENS